MNFIDFKLMMMLKLEFWRSFEIVKKSLILL